MGELGQVDHKHLIGDGLTQAEGKVHLRVLELLGVQHTLHRHDLRFLVGYLYTNGALTGYRRDNTDAKRRKTQRNVGFQSTDAVDAHTFSRCNLIERDRRTDGGINLTDFNAKVTQHLNDAVVVGLDLIHVNHRLIIVFLQ